MKPNTRACQEGKRAMEKDCGTTSNQSITKAYIVSVCTANATKVNGSDPNGVNMGLDTLNSNAFKEVRNKIACLFILFTFQSDEKLFCRFNVPLSTTTILCAPASKRLRACFDMLYSGTLLLLHSTPSPTIFFATLELFKPAKIDKSYLPHFHQSSLIIFDTIQVN